jgi:hypothetical protein
MRNALRPYMTAGVAVVGATALAIAPVIATPPDVKIVNPAVNETASPLDTYVDTVREALENLDALLGSAPALPAPTGWTLELALDSLFSDPSGEVQLFVEDVHALGPLGGASLPAVLENAADAVETAIDRAADGDVELAIVSLIRTYVTLAPAVAAVLGAPLKLLGPGVEAVAHVVLAKSLNAAVGPVLSGFGKTDVALQDIVNALNEAGPGSGSLLRALIAAPGTVADGILNGFGAVLTPPPPAALTNFRAPENTRVVTIDAKASRADIVGDQKLFVDDSKDVQDLDAGSELEAGTNQKVMAGGDGPGQPETAKARARIFGGDSRAQGAGGAGLIRVRQGIRHGVREFRDGLRDAVKTATGRDGDQADAGQAADGDSSGQ